MRSHSNMSLLITGGGTGIGAGTAAYFVERGARVTICGRRADKLNAVAEALGPRCCAVVGDIAVAQDRQHILDAALQHGGGLDALVNNAANMLRGNITDLSEQQLLDVFHVNVVAAMMLSGLAVPHLRERRGAIVYFGSVHTRRAYPGASPYAATKGALETITKVLAAELGKDQIRVNCVVPGAVPTDLNIRAGLFTEEEHDKRMDAIAPYHVLGRVGRPVEVAEAVDYCLRAEWFTGQSVVIDGGLSLGMSSF
ncbi:MAG: SDR family oxidoreductase [Rhodoferax sp.]|nr:SDR family oxidoreductase [Rhodoferax sp.]